MTKLIEISWIYGTDHVDALKTKMEADIKDRFIVWNTELKSKPNSTGPCGDDDACDGLTVTVTDKGGKMAVYIKLDGVP